METHLASVGFWKSLTGDDLEEKHQFESIAEIIIDILDCCSSFTQMAVAPGGEGLIWGNKHNNLVVSKHEKLSYLSFQGDNEVSRVSSKLSA